MWVFGLLHVASFIDHKIIWIYKVQNGYLKIFKKNGNFIRTMKSGLRPFENKLIKYWFKIIFFQCSKNYGSPARVTRLKVEQNMADPFSLNENLL